MWTDINFDDVEYNHKLVWEETWAWIPHRSSASGQWIWLTRARRATVCYSDGTVMEQRWMTRDEWLIEMLKGN